jgi:hypothetical protein
MEVLTIVGFRLGALDQCNSFQKPRRTEQKIQELDRDGHDVDFQCNLIHLRYFGPSASKHGNDCFPNCEGSGYN